MYQIFRVETVGLGEKIYPQPQNPELSSLEQAYAALHMLAEQENPEDVHFVLHVDGTCVASTIH